MSSIFSFLSRPARPVEEGEIIDATPASPLLLAPPPVAAAMTLTTGKPSPAEVMAEMVNLLRSFISSSLPIGSLPPATVSIATVTDKTVGLGNFRGNARRGGMTLVALKGGRLSGVARFQLWADSPAEVGELTDALHGRLLVAKDNLWQAGFLKFVSQGASLPEHATSLDAWHKTLDYEFLYEYQYEDSDGAESLIAAIPIHADPEQSDSPQRETTVVTDSLVRWDETAAPTLALAGPATIRHLAALLFVPGTMPGGAVEIVRTFAGAAVPPTSYGTLEEFMAAITRPGNPERNGRFTFPSFTDFLAVFAAAGDLIALGDWDESNVPDTYEARQLAWTPPIHLTKSVDRLQIIYAPGNSEPQFDQVGVMYLRAGR